VIQCSFEVQACGSVEGQPHAMLIPMEYLLMGYGLYRPPCAWSNQSDGDTCRSCKMQELRAQIKYVGLQLLKVLILRE